jgi:hypothetical protein
VYTDASNKHLGAVIMQEGKPLAFYSRKLNSEQKRYTTGEQELLGSQVVQVFILYYIAFSHGAKLSIQN